MSTTYRYPQSGLQLMGRHFAELRIGRFEFKKHFLLWLRNRMERRVRAKACVEVGNTISRRGTEKELKFAGWEHVGNIIDHDMETHDDVCFYVVAMVANKNNISLEQALRTYDMFAQMDLIRHDYCDGWNATCWARPKNLVYLNQA